MSDTQSQFSEQPISSTPSSAQFSDEPLRSGGPALDALASPPSVQRRLRLWPGVVIIAVQWIAVKCIELLTRDTEAEMMGFQAAMFAPMIGALAVLLWWLFFSRLTWPDRVIVPVAMIVFGALVAVLGDPTIGPALFFYALPFTMTAWIVWLILALWLVPLVRARPLSWPTCRAGLALLFMLTAGYFSLLRFDGVTGGFRAALNWRWTPTAEEAFLAERAAPTLTKEPAKDAVPLALQAGDWPGFRGPNRDNRLTGVKIATDWDKNPPKLLWKHKVGPGWGSFAVVGKHVYTQEQWDQKEAVVCYDADTGKIIWSHEDDARFTEPLAGPGPRATPTFQDGKLYTMGAAGQVCCLDAATGKEIWSQNLKVILDQTETKVPMWGFSASPLVMQGIVMVFAGAPDQCVVGYDAATGKLAWTAGKGKDTYSSLQRATIDGVEQALMMTGEGLFALQPLNGAILWNYEWDLKGAARCVQPGAVGNADFLVGSPFGSGTHRIRIDHKDGKWERQNIWESNKISPYFSDFVTHRDHMFGFTGEFFACVGLDKGKVKWKERGFRDDEASKYGSGQVLLLADQDLLLIVTEQGAVALVEANPAEQKVLAHFQAIAGKTWNHPVVAHGRLYVRNGEEAACYQLLAR
jgi:outer membrane protein assembly factor BamB